ncbi:hypothetical protein ACX80O_02285 [Arthrobacter sp. Hz1]
MSRSQLTRTPANFPRMKHRAASRRATKKVNGLIEIVRWFRDFKVRLGAAVSRAADILLGAQREQRQAQFQLMPPPQDQTILVGMLADAEGQQLVQRILDRKQGT